MVEVAFFAGAIGALGGAIAVIALRNPFYSVLALVVHLVSLAGLFLILYAQFVAAVQIVVYAGAVMVLYVFVAAYVGGAEEPLWEPIPGQRLVAPLLAVALFIELSIAVLGTGLQAIDSEGAGLSTAFGTPADIGRLLLTKFLLAFEVASYILLVAAARRRLRDARADRGAVPGALPDRVRGGVRALAHSRRRRGGARGTPEGVAGWRLSGISSCRRCCSRPASAGS
jgi:NADH:ubiquinone oxidoreductase subunit 6 (subunit J)